MSFSSKVFHGSVHESLFCGGAVTRTKEEYRLRVPRLTLFVSFKVLSFFYANLLFWVVAASSCFCLYHFPFFFFFSIFPYNFSYFSRQKFSFFHHVFFFSLYFVRVNFTHSIIHSFFALRILRCREKIRK